MAVVCVATALKQLAEEAAQVVIVGALVEIQILAVLQVLGELFGAAARQLLDRRLDLLLLDAVVLIILVLSRQALPGQRSLKEVKQDVPNALHIVTTRLLDADMCVDTGVTGGAC